MHYKIEILWVPNIPMQKKCQPYYNKSFFHPFDNTSSQHHKKNRKDNQNSSISLHKPTFHLRTQLLTITDGYV